MWGLIPGEVDEPRNLDQMLREYHDELAASQLRRIEKRKADGIPLSDALPLDKAAARAATALEEDEPTLALALLEASLFGAMRPLAPYDGDPGLAGVEVTFKGYSKAQMLDWQRREAQHRDKTPTEQMIAALPIIHEAFRACVHEVKGLSGPGGGAVVRAGAEGELDENGLARIDSANLTASIWTALKRFDALRGDAKKNYGTRRVKTSAASTATPAQSGSESPEGVGTTGSIGLAS